MNSKIGRLIDSRVVSALVVAAFCVASGLSIYSGDQIAMTVGTRDANLFVRASHFFTIAFQLWLYPIYWLSRTFHTFTPHESITSSLVTSACSAVLLFSLVRLLARRFSFAARSIIGLLLFCTVVEAYSFTADMQRLKAIDDSYSGP